MRYLRLILIIGVAVGVGAACAVEQRDCATRFGCSSGQSCDPLQGCADVTTDATPDAKPACESHSCPPAAARCVGDKRQACRVGPDGCRRWDPALDTCAAGEVCRKDRCAALCQQDAQCPDDSRCVDGICEICPVECLESKMDCRGSADAPQCENRSPDGFPNCSGSGSICKEVQICHADQCPPAP